MLQRLKEPSSWAGFAVLLPTLIQCLAGGFTPAAIAQIAGGVAAVLLPEAAK